MSGAGVMIAAAAGGGPPTTGGASSSVPRHHQGTPLEKNGSMASITAGGALGGGGGGMTTNLSLATSGGSPAGSSAAGGGALGAGGSPSPNASPTPWASLSDAMRGAISRGDRSGVIQVLDHTCKVPAAVSHLVILRFAQQHEAQLRDLAASWQAKRIPLPDSLFGACYLHAKQVLGKELCMKHNGRGKNGIGYAQCLFEGQCKFLHECVYCGQTDHGWYNVEGCRTRLVVTDLLYNKLGLTDDELAQAARLM